MKPQISYLAPGEIDRLHHCALEILSDIGMRFPSTEALALLSAAGARVGDDQVVRIPPKLVAAALDTVPCRSQVTLYGRDPRHDVTFDTRRPALACMTMAVGVIDPHTRRKRPATSEDLAALTRIADGLVNIRVNGGLVTPQEVPGELNDWYTWAITLKNTTKHITGGMLGARCVRDAARMAAIALGAEADFKRRPSISGWVLTLPPLGIDAESLEALMEMSRLSIPAIISSGPILGTSAPITLAGTVAQAHAEILGCLVVSQLVNPGAPSVYTSFARGIDMQTGNISMAGPEFGILKSAMAQMGRSLGLPVRMPGMLRDAKLLDAQAGFETGMIGTLSGLSADIMDGMQLDMDLVVDFADLIFCDDCAGAVDRLARELVVSDDTLALDVIKAVGPGGTFLDQDHTLGHFRRELWSPALFERRDWETWKADGAGDIFQKAQERVLALLGTEQEPLLPASAEAAIDAVVDEARGQRSRGRG